MEKICVRHILECFLCPQVDASQGAEEMVEHLTEKTLQQEEKLQQLEEEKADLVFFKCNANPK